jgi:hypothetical protein
MTRREFIALVGSTATLWPRAAVAQRAGKVQRIGILYGQLMSGAGTASDNAFRRELQELGWTDGRNVRIDYHSAANVPDRISAFAKELVELQPDVILAESTPVVAALLNETHTIPIVFVHVPDPVASGFVQSLARPGGNVTGFTFINEDSVVGKGSRYSRRSRRSLRGSRSCSTPMQPPRADRTSGLRSRQPPRLSQWRRLERPFTTIPRSPLSSRCLGANHLAG